MRFIPGLLMELTVLAAVGALFVWVRRSRGSEPESKPAGRITLLTEAIGYVGAVLVLAGGGVAIGQRWGDLSDPARLALLATATVFFLGVGFVSNRSSEPALQRLTSVVWFIATGMTAGTLAFWFTQFLTVSDQTTLLLVAASTTLVAIALYAVQRMAAQQLATFGGIVATTLASINSIAQGYPAWVGAMAAWTIGAAWLLLGWKRRIEPWWTAVTVGMITVLLTPSFISESSEAAVFAVGIASAAGLMAVSVGARFPPGLVLGAVGLFGYVTGAVVRYFGDTLGVPAALAITGGVILVVAASTGRLVRMTTTRPPVGDAQPPAQDEPLRRTG